MLPSFSVSLLSIGVFGLIALANWFISRQILGPGATPRSERYVDDLAGRRPARKLSGHGSERRHADAA